MSDYVKMRVGNYYVDKTRYVADLDAAGDGLFFLRPRSFGKSLWLAVLDAAAPREA
ncbi:MAG: AAA family ATPase [Acidobacteriota bacterium]